MHGLMPYMYAAPHFSFSSQLKFCWLMFITGSYRTCIYSWSHYRYPRHSPRPARLPKLRAHTMCKCTHARILCLYTRVHMQKTSIIHSVSQHLRSLSVNYDVRHSLPWRHVHTPSDVTITVMTSHAVFMTAQWYTHATVTMASHWCSLPWRHTTWRHTDPRD